ncbi:MAG TPA: chitobiase/beta-hexosaminidase C-terminal domain-containing protein [Methylomirabilota bacterium]|nr:chitobiase/beta-hexosaminidase C-terminal domain-containing protein [Methylomirabilota bacterium]
MEISTRRPCSVAALWLFFCLGSIGAPTFGLTVKEDYLVTYQGYEGSSWPHVHAITRFPDGGVLFTLGVNSGIWGPMVGFHKRNRRGISQWRHEVRGAYYDNTPYTITKEGGLLYASGTNLVLLNTAGEVVWKRPTKGGLNRYVGEPRLTISQGPDGTIWRTGLLGIDTTNSTSGKPGVLKFTPDGAELWTKSFDLPGAAFAAIGGADGSVLVLGRPSDPKSEPPLPRETWAVHLSSRGLKRWEKRFPIWVQDVFTVNDGWLFGHTSSNAYPSLPESPAGYGQYDMRVLRVDAAGLPSEEAVFGGTSHDWFHRFETNKLGELFVIGSSISGVGGNKTSPFLRAIANTWIVKPDNALRPQWDVSWPPYGPLFWNADGGFTLAGYPLALNSSGAYSVNSAVIEVLRIGAQGTLLGYGYENVYSGMELEPPVPVEREGETLLATLHSGFGTGVSYRTITPERSVTPGGTPIVSWIDESEAGSTNWSARVSIRSSFSDAVIHYTLDGSIPKTNSPIYVEPFTVSETTSVHALALQNDSGKAEIGWPTVIKAGAPLTVSVEMKHGALLITPSKPGTYQLERTSSLSAPDWEPVGLAGAERTITVPVSAYPAFFRVKRVE